jgi:hypothetical protein
MAHSSSAIRDVSDLGLHKRTLRDAAHNAAHFTKTSEPLFVCNSVPLRCFCHDSQYITLKGFPWRFLGHAVVAHPECIRIQ